MSSDTCPICRKHVMEYRDAVLEREAMRDHRDYLKAEVERLTKDMLRVAQAVGIVYQADFHADVAGPIDTIVASIESAVAARRERGGLKAEVRLRAVLATLLHHIDEMPNPHSDPMRHYYNQMQVWKGDARDAAKEATDGQ